MALRHETQTAAATVGDEVVHGAALAALGKAALSGDPIDLLFEGTCALLAEELAVDHVEIIAPSRREGTFEIIASRGWPTDKKGDLLELPIGAILGWVYTSETNILVDDARKDGRFNLRQSAVDNGVRSVIAVPIPGALTPYGVIAVYSRSSNAFDAGDVDFVSWSATVAGAAVRSARTLADREAEAKLERRRAEFQQAIAACARHLLASTGADRVERALEALLRASDADYVYARRNITTDDGVPAFQTVASAYAENIPEAVATDPYWDEVSWSSLPTALEDLSAGKDHVVIPDRLEPAERAIYDQSPIDIVSQLDIPVFVNEEWVGVIGFADETSLLEWSADDLLLLRAAGSMVGAFWERAANHEALEAVLASKNEFLATVSHELRTPLTSVLGMADEMRERFDDLTDDERNVVLDTICAESLDMSHLIEDLLTAARVDAGRLTVSHREIDLRHEVDRILHELPAVSATPVEGETLAWGDDFRVRQIIRNLLTNAVRYGGDELRITITQFGAQAVITVADNGDGIPNGDSERLFHAFERGSQLIGNPQPIGLGLAVSRELARLMLGDLTYTYDKGWCTFALSLPHTEQDAASVDLAEMFPPNG